MPKKDASKTHVPKSSLSMKKKVAGRTAKFKTSSWYVDAARSVGINKGRPPKKREK